jgi:hypothetical protein
MPHNLVCQNLSGIGHSACLDFCHGRMEISGRVVFSFTIAIAALSGRAIFNPNRQFWVHGGSPKAQVRLVNRTHVKT